MAHGRWQAIALLPLLLLACDDNPTGPRGLTVDLTLSPDHVHILQSVVTFTVEVRDARGRLVSDFDALQVERRQSGSDTWRGVELTLQSGVYKGTYTFASSGEYELRVTGARPGETEARVLYTVPEMLHVARAHAEAGGLRVEFEAFPGHIHEGNSAALRFWVMEVDRNSEGVRPPITGLTGEIHCVESGGVEDLMALTEIEAGVYEAEHLFANAGEAHVGLHFTAPDNSAAEAAYEVDIAHAH